MVPGDATGEEISELPVALRGTGVWQGDRGKISMMCVWVIYRQTQRGGGHAHSLC